MRPPRTTLFGRSGSCDTESSIRRLRELPESGPAGGNAEHVGQRGAGHFDHVFHREPVHVLGPCSGHDRADRVWPRADRPCPARRLHRLPPVQQLDPEGEHVADHELVARSSLKAFAVLWPTALSSSSSIASRRVNTKRSSGPGTVFGGGSSGLLERRPSRPLIAPARSDATDFSHWRI